MFPVFLLRNNANWRKITSRDRVKSSASANKSKKTSRRRKSSHIRSSLSVAEPLFSTPFRPQGVRLRLSLQNELSLLLVRKENTPHPMMGNIRLSTIQQTFLSLNGTKQLIHFSSFFFLHTVSFREEVVFACLTEIRVRPRHPSESGSQAWQHPHLTVSPTLPDLQGLP